MKGRRKSAWAAVLVALMICPGLKNGRADFVLPTNLTEIEDEAFAGDESLTAVTVPNEVSRIGASAFYGCSGLNRVTVPGSVNEIGVYAFGGCGEALLIETEEGSEALTYARANQIDYQAGTRYRALLIGQLYTGSNLISELIGPENDVYGMQARLSEIGWSVTAAKDLTAEGIVSAIKSVFTGASENDVSLLYYSGHGDEDGSLVGADAVDLTPASLRRAMDGVQGRKVVIVDACYSGQLISEEDETEAVVSSAAEAAEGKTENSTEVVRSSAAADETVTTAADSGQAKSDASAGAESFMNAFQRAFRPRLRGALNSGGGSYFVITAARADEESAENYIPSDGSWRDVGYFTHYLCLGIGYNSVSRRTCDLAADANGDGAVSIQEAYAYAYENALALNDEQHATVWPAGCRWFAPFRP